MKDIARDLNVSVMTVSKVLRNHGDISKATRERVLQRVRELNYAPNHAAQSLATGRSLSIGLIVPDLEHPFFSEIAKAIARRIRARDYGLIIASSEDNPALEQSELERMLARQVDAVILASVQTSIASPSFERLQESRAPYVLIDREFPGLDANYVGVDDQAIGKAATEHLIERGCKLIAHLRGPDVSTAEGRLKGYEEALRKHGMALHPDYVVRVKGGDARSEEQGFVAMSRLLAMPRRPDGVFCYNDEVAIGALRAILREGLRVPGEIAVIGVDNIRYADLLRIPLSSIDQNSYRIGERAAGLALKLIEADEPPAARRVILPAELVPRDSTATAARRARRLKK
ncbi:MAG TPA: LacI family DNA-binding transcriptional regulator [Bryobacteraceae bacterium]|nr:LacI family DNA-binding transcriptional regulator [Bryobacteraceae bacterium]